MLYLGRGDFMKKTMVITGVTSGIGKALTMYFIQDGYDVIGLGRNPVKCDALAKEAKALQSKGSLTVLTCDFTSLKRIDETITIITSRLKEGLDVLINNAAMVPRLKQITEDGFERQYQVNHLAPVLFTTRLFPLLKRRNGIVITSSSEAHKRAKFDATDIEALKKYHSFRSYCRTKLYNVMMTNYFRRTFKGVQFYAVHPGRVKTEIGTKDTSQFYALFWRWFTRKGFHPKDTVQTYAYLLQKNGGDDHYFYLSKPLPVLAISNDLNAQDIVMQKAYKDLSGYCVKPEKQGVFL